MLLHYLVICETLMFARQAINDKLQGSVATYLRYGRFINNQIKKVAEFVSEKNLKSMNIWQSYRQERYFFVHFLLLAVR